MKTAGEEDIRTPHPIPLAIRYKNHQKSRAYFSHLAPFVLFYQKAKAKKGGMAQWPPLNTLLTETYQTLLMEFAVSAPHYLFKIFRFATGCGAFLPFTE